MGRHVDCQECSLIYELAVYGYADVRLYRIADLDAAIAASDSRRREAEAFYAASPVLQGLRRQLMNILSKADTKAAKYRVLDACNLTRSSLNTWRRDYVSDEETVARVVHWIFNDPEGVYHRVVFDTASIIAVRRRYNEIEGASVSRWFGRAHGVPYEQLAEFASAQA
jgi:hypothetical protein